MDHRQPEQRSRWPRSAWRDRATAVEYATEVPEASHRLGADNDEYSEALAHRHNLRVFGLVGVDGLNFIPRPLEIIKDDTDAKLMVSLLFGSGCWWCEWIVFLRRAWNRCMELLAA